MAHETTHRFTCDRCGKTKTAATPLPAGWARVTIATLADDGDNAPNQLHDLCGDCAPAAEKALGVTFHPEATDGK